MRLFLWFSNTVLFPFSLKLILHFVYVAFQKFTEGNKLLWQQSMHLKVCSHILFTFEVVWQIVWQGVWMRKANEVSIGMNPIF